MQVYYHGEATEHVSTHAVRLLKESTVADVIADVSHACHVQVYYHGEATEHVSTHDVRLPKESTIADVIAALRALLPPDKCPERLRLLEVFYSKIYKVWGG